MVPSLPLLSYESSVSVKENPDRKKKYIYIYILSKYILRLSSSRSYRITFVFWMFFFFFLHFYNLFTFYKIFHKKFLHLLHYIEEILHCPSNYTGKNIIDHFQKYFPSVTLIISIRIDLS